MVHIAWLRTFWGKLQKVFRVTLRRQVVLLTGVLSKISHPSPFGFKKQGPSLAAWEERAGAPGWGGSSQGWFLGCFACQGLSSAPVSAGGNASPPVLVSATLLQGC